MYNFFNITQDWVKCGGISSARSAITSRGTISWSKISHLRILFQNLSVLFLNSLVGVRMKFQKATFINRRKDTITIICVPSPATDFSNFVLSINFHSYIVKLQPKASQRALYNQRKNQLGLRASRALQWPKEEPRADPDTREPSFVYEQVESKCGEKDREKERGTEKESATET